MNSPNCPCCGGNTVNASPWDIPTHCCVECGCEWSETRRTASRAAMRQYSHGDVNHIPIIRQQRPRRLTVAKEEVQNTIEAERRTHLASLARMLAARQKRMDQFERKLDYPSKAWELELQLLRQDISTLKVTMDLVRKFYTKGV